MRDRGDLVKLAVFRGLYLGDLIAATGALRALRRGYPGAEIMLVSLPWASALAPHLPFVDRLLPYPGAPGLDGGDDEEDLEEFLARMRAERFDLAINMHGRGPTSTKLVARFGARRIASFVGEKGRDIPALDLEVHWDTEAHESRKLLLLAEKVAGVPAHASGSPEPGLLVRDEDDHRARALLPTNLQQEWSCPKSRGKCRQGASGIEKNPTPYSLLPTPRSGAKRSDPERSDKPLALVHPGASVPEKRWPGEAFRQVAEDLTRQGYTVAVTGGAGERGLAREVAVPGSLDLGGRTDLSTLIALAARADVMVSNDTGPAHLAYALKTPSVTIFGPSTDVERWGPLDRERHIILRGDLIPEVPVEAVLESVEALVVRRERLGV